MSDKAIISTGTGQDAVEFTTASGRIFDNYSAIDYEYEGTLVVFNCFEKHFNQLSEADPSVIEKLIDGVTSEISVAVSKGWQKIFFCTFNDFSLSFDHLPLTFSIDDNEDYIFYQGQEKAFANMVKKHADVLKYVRAVGIISLTELENFQKMISGFVDFQADSPYLITVDA